MEAIAQPTERTLDPTRIFRLLGEETRLRAALLLQQRPELCVCELTEATGVSQPKMSRHLGHLRDVGLVETRRSGQWVHYALRRDLPEWLRQTLATLAGERPFADDLAELRNAIIRHRGYCEE
ncbi:metalloregulator ArsR/SmtB family transcription factor [Spiribacter vilamensis]|uniref:ArsR family transcriptional regulator n=1 Tax=Spiribacter vilamensis TaxID=531306 RepID=A0A4Q8D240_9GAMM|nr:metalloregulator ArsR/SmtB family transcription factor [Spiribacter vilamensis]RZU99439.1 ArsR family transcriptional regulator [Spiribacter vilamensis]TVO61588.1 metalloregulator ArsR/SmtB family transcription factor [Spiribacter vilamensis]